jgi:hypothetical protein
MKELVKCIENIKVVVNSIDESTFEKHYSVPLDCSGLPILNPNDESQHFIKLSDFFGALSVAKQPTLYWFIVTSNHTSKQLTDKVKKAVRNMKRHFPKLDRKRIGKSESKVLYVGKTRSELKGRMISHLGYHRNNDNHGLQLCHRA